MHLTIRHRTLYQYEPAVSRVALRLKLFPRPTVSQTPGAWTVTVNNEVVAPAFINGYGDSEAIWIDHNSLSEVEVIAEGDITTENTNGVLTKWQMAAPPAVFLRDTPLTEADERIRELAASVTSTGLARGHDMSNAVRDAVAYVSGSTHSRTTAAEALLTGEGVCQDHAHVFCAAMRAAGVPARYVAGYLYTGTKEATEGVPHQSESHAWAEAYIEDFGWIGFDPSNRICPTEKYVRLAAGLDARDASPLRGSVLGDTSESLETDVAVSAAQQQ